MSASSPNVNTVTLVEPSTRYFGSWRTVAASATCVSRSTTSATSRRCSSTSPRSAPAPRRGAEYLTKGRAVAVTGRLVYREWQAKDGSKHSKYSVVGQVSFGGRPDDDTKSE